MRTKQKSWTCDLLEISSGSVEAISVPGLRCVLPVQMLAACAVMYVPHHTETDTFEHNHIELRLLSAHVLGKMALLSAVFAVSWTNTDLLPVTPTTGDSQHVAITQPPSLSQLPSMRGQQGVDFKLISSLATALRLLDWE